MSSHPRVILFANEKGGTGKTTLAFHVAVGLAGRGRGVGLLDLDPGQQSLTRYLENRRTTARPDAVAVHGASLEPGILHAEPEAQACRLGSELDGLARHDAVILDAPGARTPLSRAALHHADMLVTPVNDSVLDLSALAELDTASRTVKGPSPFARFVWEENSNRVLDGRSPLRWIVVRNRVPHVHSRNRETVDYLLGELGWRLRFEVGPQIHERVVYRELFLHGLTLPDVARPDSATLSRSHLAALAELDRLVAVVEASPADASSGSANTELPG